MKKLLIATLASTVATLSLAHAEAPKVDDNGHHGFRSEMRELIRGEGLDKAALQDLLQKRAEARFASADADKDGNLTRDEALASAKTRAEARFAEMDKNGDGLVKRSDGEGPGHHGRRGEGPRGEGFRHGPQGDRNLTPEQRAERRDARSAEQFARLDADSDGVISQEEWNAGQQARAECWEERREQRAERREQRQERRAEARERMPEEIREVHSKLRELTREGMNVEAYTSLMQELAGARFDKLDTEKTGSLTLETYTVSIPARADEMFARMDRNEDGKVTREDHPRHGGGHKGAAEKPQPKD